MSVKQTAKISFALSVMMFITLLLAAGTALYLSHSADTEETLRADRDIIVLNGPWKFTVGDDPQYARPGYDDAGWGTMDLTAPPGAHDDDVGLSGFIPGWRAKGYANYAGYAWYRLKIPSESLTGNELALTAPPAVEDAYQLFVNGSLLGGAGDFSAAVPVIYSIRPRLFRLPENVKKEKDLTIAFRVWMSPAGRGPDSGGIHIAPAIGEKAHLEKKYEFQWGQTVKGYLVEVVLPVMFLLLAAAIYLLNRSEKPPRSSKWLIAALGLLALVRLNQAVYFWFQIESARQAVILGTAILRPLMLGGWLMAWREWFDLHRPKWLPVIIATLVLLYMATQALGIFWVSNAFLHSHYPAIVDYIRLALLAVMLLTLYQKIRQPGAKDLLALAAALLISIGLFPQEVSELHLIPGIWFPFGVGVSRSQFFYAAFVFVMYAVLIRKNRKPPAAANSEQIRN